MTTNTSDTSTTFYNGRVKWFNNKTGYGFITIVSSLNNHSTDLSVSTDVFSHHSSIQVNDEQYRYLVQGEYVQFSVNTLENSEHKYQAQNITGIAGGSLLCETRNENRTIKPQQPITRPSRSTRPTQN
jgi:cold shock CspA family protein|tara:strand:- start:11 stop:394 length:384 start_codon:yes stop_codon:yes gene_type:complete